ncbi:hypothetical protein EV360DRAFT_89632 [Lentinula raphanica]|nr:hypothetical protein EV360DRAFT_89632 [Lentinula raphanica]
MDWRELENDEGEGMYPEGWREEKALEELESRETRDFIYVPTRFFTKMESWFAGPYASEWSLEVVKPSPIDELAWNKPFSPCVPGRFRLLKCTFLENQENEDKTPSGRANQAFSTSPYDGTARKDFTTRFLYEEDNYASLGGEIRPVVIYHVVHRRDMEFDLETMERWIGEYERFKMKTKLKKRGGPYKFSWNNNVIRSKVVRRFYKEKEGEGWVVRERGTGRYVRGRRDAVEEAAFEMWMGREEVVHPAWRGALDDFERILSGVIDNEWVVDYEERIRRAYEFWPSLVREA